MLQRIFDYFDKSRVDPVTRDIRIANALSIISICITISFWTIYVLVKLHNFLLFQP